MIFILIYFKYINACVVLSLDIFDIFMFFAGNHSYHRLIYPVMSDK